eukprot:scaffold3498_cov112-Isochrysis_galbana.AAC.4
MACSCGVLHRDLKLENLMLTKHDSSLRVIDFGLAHQYGMQEDGKTPKVKSVRLVEGGKGALGVEGGDANAERGHVAANAHIICRGSDPCLAPAADPRRCPTIRPRRSRAVHPNIAARHATRNTSA